MSNPTIKKYPKSSDFKKWLKEVDNDSHGAGVRNKQAHSLLDKPSGKKTISKFKAVLLAIFASVAMIFAGSSATASDTGHHPPENTAILERPYFFPDWEFTDSLTASDYLSIFNSALMLLQLIMVLIQVLILLKIRRNLQSGTYDRGHTKTTDAEGQENPVTTEKEIREKHSSLIGGATLTGRVRTENQDVFCCRDLEGGRSLITVFDGIGGKPGGREAAQFTAQFVSDWFSKLASNDPLWGSECCVQVLSECQKAFKDCQIGGGTTAIVGLIDGYWLHYAVLGDGALSIIHADGMVHECFAPHHALNKPDNIITASMNKTRAYQPRQGSIKLETGALVFAMTDGASDLLPIDQIAIRRNDYQEKLKTFGANKVALKILRDLEEARHENGAFQHSDNMTCAIALI